MRAAGRFAAVNLAAVSLCATAGAAADRAPAVLRWSELGSFLVDKRIAVVLPEGARIEGDVLAVRPDALILDIRKTSDRRSYPKGQFALKRAGLSSLRIVRVAGPWRMVGGIAGAVCGMGLAFLGAYYESAALGWAGFLAGVPVGSLAGYYLGKAADREVTEIRILAEPEAEEGQR